MVEKSVVWFELSLAEMIRLVRVCNLITDVPGAPTDVKAFDIDDSSLTLSWHPPKNNGGAEISGYYVERRTGFNPRWITVNRKLVHIPTLTMSDLIEGRDYEFRVIAENEVGMSKPSDTAGPYKAQEPYGECLSRW